MKILQLVSSLGVGGAEKFVSDLVIQQKKDGNDVCLLVLDRAKDIGKCSSYERGLYNKLEDENVNVIFVGGRGRRNPIRVYRKLNKVLQQNKPDIVHSHLIWWSCFLTLTKHNFKHVYTQHINHLGRKPLHELILHRFIDVYVTICDEAYEDVTNTLPKSTKVDKVVNGLVVEDYKYRNRKDDDVINLVTISRLTDQKNHGLIIDVLSKINVDKPDLNFCLNIVGDGPLRGSLEDKVKESGLSKLVVFHGTKSNIAEILDSNDLYLLPSKAEGFSISLIEALSSGIRIIASDVGGNAETLDYGNLGTLVVKNDFSSLFNSIVDHLESRSKCNEKSEVMSKLQELSIEACSSNHIDLYANLMK